MKKECNPWFYVAASCAITLTVSYGANYIAQHKKQKETKLASDREHACQVIANQIVGDSQKGVMNEKGCFITSSHFNAEDYYINDSFLVSVSADDDMRVLVNTIEDIVYNNHFKEEAFDNEICAEKLKNAAKKAKNDRRS